MNKTCALSHRVLHTLLAGLYAVLGGLTFANSLQAAEPDAGPRFVALPPAEGAPAALTRSGSLASEEAAALERLNARRALLGLPALNRSPLIDAAARGHANYLVCNDSTGHEQIAGRPCFTGASVGERVRAAGYQWTSVYEVISADRSSGAAAIDSLITAIYHRFALFATDVSEIGIAMMSGHPTFGTVLTANPATNQSPRPAMSATWVGVYPADGQTEVPRDFDSDTESPDPVPERNKVGYPVSLHVDGNLSLSVTSFTLSKDGVSLPGRLLAPGGPSTPRSVAAFIPLAALDYGTTYTARFVGSAGGRPIDKTWRFTTAAWTPIRFCPSDPVAGPNLRFTLQLSGGSGRYTNVAWRYSGTPIADLAWASDTALSITTGSGGSATLTVRDSDGREASTTLTVQAGAGLPASDCGGSPPAAPAVSLSSSSLNFGSIALGSTSAGQSITLTNRGTAPLSLGALEASGDFRLSHDCPSSLAAGQSCTLTVVFQPTAAGSRTGTLTITSNASGAPHTVSLSGSGQSSSVATPARFGAQVSGPLSRQSIDLTLTPATADLGQIRDIYLAALDGEDIYFYSDETGWVWFDGSPPPRLDAMRLTGPLSFAVARDDDVRPLCGVQIAIGYGQSFAEMVMARRYAIVHTLCQP